jgi:hypothetical protein
MNIDIDGFLATLPIMLIGMLGIFVVIVVIYAAVALLLKVFPEKKEKEKDN